MLTAEVKRLVEAAALAVAVGLQVRGGYDPPPMLKVPKETAWRLYNSILGVPTADSFTANRYTPADFEKWRSHALPTLGTIFGDESALVKQLAGVRVEPEIAIAGGLGDDYHAKIYQQGCDQAWSILLAANQRINSAPDDPPEPSPAVHHANHSGHTMLHITKADALTRLERALNGLPKGKDHQSMIFTAWHHQTHTDLKASFGNDSPIAKQFELIQFRSTVSRQISFSSIQRNGRDAASKIGDAQHDQRNRDAYEEGCKRAETSLKELIEVVTKLPDVPPNPAPAKEKQMGAFGDMVRGDFRMMLREAGKPVSIFKNYGKPDQTKTQSRALKVDNQGDAFQFLDVIDIVPGDVIQEEGSTKKWRVTDTTEHTEDGVFTDFEASVVRETGAAQPPAPVSGPTYNVAGNYIANNQINSPHATQNVSVSINQQVLDQVNMIKREVEHSELDPHYKEEIGLALDRVCQLAKREPSEMTKATINEKLTTVEKMISVATKLAPIVGPGLIALRLLLAHHGI